MATEVGSVYVSVYPNTKDFADELYEGLNGTSVGKALGKTGTKLGNSLNSTLSPLTVAAGNLISDVIGGAWSLTTENFSKGVQRLDTMNNFPKLMQQFGFGADEAARAVQTVQDHLMGLPGASDEVLRLVQSLSDSTSSLDLATTTGLAFNDMLTAAGADTATATMATRMFDQMMGGAAFTSQRWYAITSKMPLQMRLVAESLLGAGASVEDLGSALEDGTVTTEMLAQAMTDLGPEFEAQARTMSNGVETAMTNIGNRVSIGIAGILDAIGQEEIAGAINGFSTAFKDGLLGIADFVGFVKGEVEKSGIPEALGRIGDAISETIGDMNLYENIKNVASDAIKGLGDALKWVADNGDIVVPVLAAIGGAIAALALADLILKIGGLVGAIGALANPVTLVIAAIGAVAGALTWFFTQTEVGRQAWAELCRNFEETAPFVAGIFEGLGRSIGGFFENLAGVFETVVGFVTGDAEKMDAGIQKALSGTENFLGGIGDAVNNFAEVVWHNAAEMLGVDVDTLKSAFDEAFQNIKKTVEGVFNDIENFMKDPLGAIKKLVKSAMDAVKKFFEKPLTDAKKAVENAFNAIKKAVEVPLNFIKKIVDTIFGGVRDTVKNTVGGAEKAVSGAWSGIKNTTSSVFNGLKSVASTAWNGVKNAVTTVADGIKNGVSTTWNGMKTAASNAWNGIKTAASTAWDGIKSAVTKAAENAKDGAKKAWDGLKDASKTAWDGIKSTASTIWDGITKAISGKMDDAKKNVANSTSGIQKAIDGVKGKTVDIDAKNKTTPKVQAAKAQIKTVEGKTVGIGANNNVGDPVRKAKDQIATVQGKKVNIELHVYKSGLSALDINARSTGLGGKRYEVMPMYQAAGGILTKMTAIYAGEAGDEAIIPLSNRRYVRPFAHAVAAEMGGGAGGGGVDIHDCTFVIRKESDIEQVASSLNNMITRQRTGALR